MFSELTMCQDIDSFIVDVKQTAETLGHGHEGSISSADVRIELQMLRHVAPSSQQTDARFWSQWFLVHIPLITLAIESFTVVLVRRIGCLRIMLVVSKRRRAGGMLVRNDEAHGCTHTREKVQKMCSLATAVSLLHQFCTRCSSSTTIRDSDLSDGAVTTETASILLIAERTHSSNTRNQFSRTWPVDLAGRNALQRRNRYDRSICRMTLILEFI